MSSIGPQRCAEVMAQSVAAVVVVHLRIVIVMSVSTYCALYIVHRHRSDLDIAVHPFSSGAAVLASFLNAVGLKT